MQTNNRWRQESEIGEKRDFRRFIAVLAALFLASSVLTACGPLTLPVFKELDARLLNSGPNGLSVPGGSNSSSSSGGGGVTTGFKVGCEEARFLRLLNMYRALNGAGPLVISISATKAAQWHTNDMGVNHYFSHTDSLGRDPYSRTADFGYGYCQGENAAAGNSDGVATFCQWKNSPGHNSNMLAGHWRALGIGRTIVGGSDYGVYWSTPFGIGSDDTIPEPVTIEPACSMPTALPGC